MAALDRFLGRYGLLKGLTSGSRGWLVVGAAASGLRLLRRAANKEPEVVYREDLGVGQSLLITHLPPVERPSRRSRRRRTQASMEA